MDFLRKGFLIFTISLISLTVLAQKKTKPFQQWAATPPMGWNSWDCYGPTVTEAEVKANADYMGKYLKSYGWEYIVVDIRWYVPNDKAHGYNESNPVFTLDPYGRFLPPVERFPSAANGKGFKPLADYIHSKGLKFGIHIMRGVPVAAVKQKLPVLGTKVTAADIYSDKDQCTWLHDMYTIVAGKEGAQEYYNSIFQLYASWGLDFVKVDDLSRPYHQQEVEMIRKAIDLTGRKIVLSTSPGETPLPSASHVQQNANMWRTVDDFWDIWSELKDHFKVFKRWNEYRVAGGWPDGDMLPLGHIGIRAERGDDRMTKFTKDEQFTLMTLWSIFRSPLLFGGDLASNDAFTLSLITNNDVLNVLKHSTNNHELFNQDDKIAWVADDPKTGDKFLALFNSADPKLIEERKALWMSGIVSKKDPIQRIELDLKGSKKLYLCVTDADNDNQQDYANWLSPNISNGKDSIKLTSLKWVKAFAQTGKARNNKSATGTLIMVNGMNYSDGIGTGANSVIEFDVPEGYSFFRSGLAIDDVARSQPNGGTVKFAVFTEDPTGPIPTDQANISVSLKELGIQGSAKVKDLWNGKDLGTVKGDFSAEIKKHGAGLYRITPVEIKKSKIKS